MERSALVVGGGPAGTSAALALRREGFAVLLAEQRTGWTGRVCGACLAPEAVGHLAALGVLDAVRAAGAVEIASAAIAPPTGAPADLPLGRDGRPALALPRHALEDALLDRARAAGAEVELGTRVTEVRRDGDGWAAATRDARGREAVRRSALVVLADGRFTLGIPGAVRPRAGWFGFNAEFAGLDRPPGALALHVHRGGYVGLVTFADGATNVCGLAWHAVGRAHPWERAWEEALARSPSLAAAVRGGRRTGEWRGVGPLPFGSALRPGAGAIPAGDAAAVGDPFMGEGIGRALGAGPLLALAFAEAGGADPARVAARYEALWTARYAARLQLGARLRAALRNRLGFLAASLTLLKRPARLAALLPAFHG